jgi:hypothetical protein
LQTGSSGSSTCTPSTSTTSACGAVSAADGLTARGYRFARGAAARANAASPGDHPPGLRFAGTATSGVSPAARA